MAHKLGVYTNQMTRKRATIHFDGLNYVVVYEYEGEAVGEFKSTSRRWCEIAAISWVNSEV